ncbi:type VI secretion system ImpA family N-terminal domain-containing protein [Hahella sp. SMD15-11]|uniref:Type VI secretion system ImpA family N-terminal domain-containing protein n=1 Tax=Thermohahella caldifontis TaxID=3142973 RepID=A0AB39V005_9GAMM
MDFETLRARVLQPVTALNPLGGDIRLDERFDAIRSEIQAWESLESETHPDWKRLSEACCHLLASESKDILLLCWLAYAWGQHVPERGVTEACLILGEALTEWGRGFIPAASASGRFAWRWIGWLPDGCRKRRSAGRTSMRPCWRR